MNSMVKIEVNIFVDIDDEIPSWYFDIKQIGKTVIDEWSFGGSLEDAVELTYEYIIEDHMFTVLREASKL